MPDVKRNARRAGLTWFEQVPRRFFAFREWHYASYSAIGYFLTGYLHYRVWLRSGAAETLLTNLEFRVPRPSAHTALVLYVLCGSLEFLIMLKLLRRLRGRRSSIELVFWGTALSIFGAGLPWIFASSVVSAVFLFVFGMTSVISYGLSTRIGTTSRSAKHLPDPWKAFVHALKSCVALLALLVGAFATSVLLPWRETRVEGPEFFRYSVLTGYLVLGLLGFILIPLLVQALDGAPTDSVDLEPPGVI